MQNSSDFVLAETINRLSATAERQHALNKAFFMVITEILKNTAVTESAVKALLKTFQADEDLSAELRGHFGSLNEMISADYKRYQQMTVLMLDAMRGDTQDMENKLNELFRKQDS